MANEKLQNYEINIYRLKSDKSKLLSFFCNAATAKDYVDKIILLEKE